MFREFLAVVGTFMLLELYCLRCDCCYVLDYSSVLEFVARGVAIVVNTLVLDIISSYCNYFFVFPRNSFINSVTFSLKLSFIE